VDGVGSVRSHFAGGGSFAVDTSGNISNVVADTNVGGAGPGETTGGTGTINAVSTTTGRATMSLSLGGKTLNQAVYMVNPDEFLIVGTDPASSGVPIYGGRAIVTASSFTLSSLSGNYMVHETGIDYPCTTGLIQSPPEFFACTEVDLDLWNMQSGSYSGTHYWYYFSPTYFVPSTFSGATYTVDASSGRVALAGRGVFPQSSATVLYIAAPTANTEPISAFYVDGSSSAAFFGFVEFQPAQTYSTSGIAGNYMDATEDPNDPAIQNFTAVVSVSSGGVITGSGYTSGSSGLGTGSADSTITIGSNGVGSRSFSSACGAPPTEVAITNGTTVFLIPQGGYYCGGAAYAAPGVVEILELQ
jgi:hypothetical protein